jgi:ABC-2 type transport system ATP-binding protein
MTEASATAMIEAHGLSKFYGNFAAVRDVSFRVPQGQVCAFLGPNGAGKSTTMKLLTGFLSPTTGEARIAGLNVATRRREATSRLGYLPENGPLYPDMTPLALLRFFGEARGLGGSHLRSRLEAVIGQCSLADVLEKPISKLSKGYRQRVGMAQVLLHEPDVLIMDEPTTGLDPNQILDVRQLIRDIGRTKTILLSTHILQEVEAVADRVLLINAGRLVFDGTAAEMLDGYPSLDEAFYARTGRLKRSEEAPVEPESPAVQAESDGEPHPAPIPADRDAPAASAVPEKRHAE